MIIAEEQGTVVDAPEADSPFCTVMKIWVRWMSLGDRQEAGGWSNPQDCKEFMRAGEAVDAMVNDLPRMHWWAIRKAHGIATVWRYPDASLADVILEAEEILTPKMLRCVDTRRYFV